MMIDFDQWLSSVLGYDAFKVSLDVNERTNGNFGSGDLDLIASHQLRFDRAFYYAKVPADQVDVVHALDAVGFRVVDVNTTYTRRPVAKEERSRDDIVIIDDILPDYYEAVLDIAESSFVYSRFHLDPLICNATANALKRAWVANYIKKKRGERLIVAVIDDTPVGFLAVLGVSSDGEQTRATDLIAVGSEHQGRGVGKAMVSYFVSRYVGVCTLLKVGTQVANLASLRLYEKEGFLMDEATFVLHAHTKLGKVL